MNDVVASAKPSRRIEEERQRRRRRDDLTDGRHRKLAVDGELDPNYVYRWINDDPGRVYNLTKQDDWDRVTEDMLNGPKSDRDRQLGSGLERIVEASGKRAILVRKRKDYYDGDKAKEQAFLDAQMTDLKRGVTPTGPKGEQTLSASDHAYVPAGGISIKDGRRT